MKYLKTFEFFDFDKHFDIDEDVLSFVFADLLDRYPFIGIQLAEVDEENFKVELFDNSLNLLIKFVIKIFILESSLIQLLV